MFLKTMTESSIVENNKTLGSGTHKSSKLHKDVKMSDEIEVVLQSQHAHLSSSEDRILFNLISSIEILKGIRDLFRS